MTLFAGRLSPFCAPITEPLLHSLICVKKIHPEKPSLSLNNRVWYMLRLMYPGYIQKVKVLVKPAEPTPFPYSFFMPQNPRRFEEEMLTVQTKVTIDADMSCHNFRVRMPPHKRPGTVTVPRQVKSVRTPI